jgi:SOS-response transcriptional repressor LexA
MSNLASKIKLCREALSLSKAEVARRAKVSPAFIGNLESGAETTMSEGRARSIAAVLGIEPIEIIELLPANHPARLKANLSAKVEAVEAAGRHPVIGTVEAGRGVDEQDAGEWVSLPKECEGADGVYVVKGRSMMGAGILPFDHLVVRRTDTPADGDLVVAWTADFGAVVKRVRVNPSSSARAGVTYTLLTEGDDKDNRDPCIMAPEDGDRIYAVVVAVFRTYKSKIVASPKSKPNGKGKK